MRQEQVQRHRPPREDPEEDPMPDFAENEASRAAARWLREHPEP